MSAARLESLQYELPTLTDPELLDVVASVAEDLRIQATWVDTEAKHAWTAAADHLTQVAQWLHTGWLPDPTELEAEIVLPLLTPSGGVETRDAAVFAEWVSAISETVLNEAAPGFERAVNVSLEPLIRLADQAVAYSFAAATGLPATPVMSRWLRWFAS